MPCPAGLADEALSALEAKAVHAQALDAELAELRAALDLREQQVAKHAAEAERLSLEVETALYTAPAVLCAKAWSSSSCLRICQQSSGVCMTTT